MQASSKGAIHSTEFNFCETLRAVGELPRGVNAVKDAGCLAQR